MIDVITGLDHVVVNVCDEMDRVAACYQRLGFRLTPRGFHTLGTLNHLAIFEDDYLELLGYPAGKCPVAGLGTMLAGQPGLVACALASTNATAVYEQARAAGIPVETPLDFSRPVELPDGFQDAAFSITRFPTSTVPGAELFVCQHHTRELVWRRDWMDHPNGVSGIAFITVVAANPRTAMTAYQRLLGGDPTPLDGGFSLTLGRMRIEVIDNPTLERRAPGLAAPSASPTARMAILGLRVTDLKATDNYLQAQGITTHRDADTLLVAAQYSGGTILAFQE